MVALPDIGMADIEPFFSVISFRPLYCNVGNAQSQA